jgi:mono/diheme cytochrome c family protein
LDAAAALFFGIGFETVAEFDEHGGDPFKDMLTDDQLNDLVAYLMSLKPKGEDSGF